MASRRPRERRGQGRIPVVLQVLLRTSRRELRLETINVNRGGLFLRTDSPLPEREMVELEINLKDGGEILKVLAVVRHIKDNAIAVLSGTQAGMGLQLYGLGDLERRRWDQLVRRSQKAARNAKRRRRSGKHNGLKQPPKSDFEITSPGGPIQIRSAAETSPKSKSRDRPLSGDVTPIKSFPQRATQEITDLDERLMADTQERVLDDVEEPEDSDFSIDDEVLELSDLNLSDGGFSGPAQSVEYRVSIPNPVALKAFADRDIRRGGIFLNTVKLLKVGDPVRLLIVHPTTSRDFALDGLVVQVVEATREQPGGIGVRFVGLVPERRRRFHEFVETGR